MYYKNKFDQFLKENKLEDIFAIMFSIGLLIAIICCIIYLSSGVYVEAIAVPAAIAILIGLIGMKITETNEKKNDKEFRSIADDIRK